MSTGASPPTTQTSWNTASKRAKARPCTAAGTSRWTRESNASLPEPAPTPSTAASSARPGTPCKAPTCITISPATATAATDPARMCSSRTRPRSRGAITAPTRLPPTLAASTTPYHQAAAWPRRKAKATRKVKKPTVKRRPPTAAAASSRTPGGSGRSAGREARPGGPSPTVHRGLPARAARTSAPGWSSGRARSDAQRRQAADDEDQGVDPQQGGRTEELEDGHAGDGGQETDDGAAYGQLGVGLHQVLVVFHRARHEAALATM